MIDPVGSALPDQPEEDQHQERGGRDREQRREQRRRQHFLVQPLPDDHPGSVHMQAEGGDGRAQHPSDKRMTGAGWKTEVPGRQVPDDRSDQPRENDLQSRLADEQLLVDDALGDGGRDLEGDEGADEVERRGPENGNARRESPRRDGGCDRVGGVVEAVREVEQEGDRDNRYECGPEHQLFLTTMLPIRCAAVSAESIAASSASKMSFHWMISLGETLSSSNSAPIASRRIASPSSSSCLSATSCFDTPRSPRSPRKAFARCSVEPTRIRHCSIACSIGLSMW